MLIMSFFTAWATLKIQLLKIIESHSKQSVNSEFDLFTFWMVIFSEFPWLRLKVLIGTSV